MALSHPSDLTTALLAHREAFKAFLVSRMGNEADAEDLLQTALVKALQRADALKDDEKAVAWFYQVLRNAITDHVRRQSAAVRRDAAWADAARLLADEPEANRQICACFEKLLPTLKPQQAELLRRVELREEPVAQAAAELGITPNHASVILRRARMELRAKLVDFCRDCSCLDRCECGGG